MRLAVLGASGRTGWLLVQLALAQGHQVRALVREAQSLPTMDGLELVQGDATSFASVLATVQGCDAVVSALGPRPDGDPMVCSQATAHVLTAMQKGGPTRYVLVSGMAQNLPGDAKGLGDRLASWLIWRLGGTAVMDKARELAELMESEAIYTALRPPRLTQAAASAKVLFDLKRCPGRSLSRGDLAASLLACVVTHSHLRQAPFISN
jgi:NAD(P)-dependent dehydrogenase (short-subunit alcohol dehydrogenase family)